MSVQTGVWECVGVGVGLWWGGREGGREGEREGGRERESVEGGGGLWA